jgi:hypothetical protein
MGKGKGSNRAVTYKKPNINHIAHQVHVTGVGAHKNVKKYSRKFNNKKVKEVIEDVMRENTAEEVAAQTPNDDDDGEE